MFHVRIVLTAPTGDDISAALSAGLPFTGHYTLTLPGGRIAENCDIVAFMHKHGSSDNRRVLQADEINVVD